MQVEDVKVGEFVELDGLIGVVILVADDSTSNLPEGHLAVWFGLEFQKRMSDSGTGGLIPEVWVVPAEHCVAVKTPVLRH